MYRGSLCHLPPDQLVRWHVTLVLCTSILDDMVQSANSIRKVTMLYVCMFSNAVIGLTPLLPTGLRSV
jgi:hypothetical protein